MPNLVKLLDRAISSFPEHVVFALEEAKQAGKKPLVYVGMSGGVDSSVSAYILKKAGFEVVGVFIKTWQPEGMICTWKDDRRDAMRVAAKLEIPFKTIYLEEEYKKHVADYMIHEYASGRTPNPDVMCNKYVKFGACYDAVMLHGADFFATGHYAQSVTLVEKTSGGVRSGHFQVALSQAKDTQKDQTYFLWAIGQEKIKHTIFPLGALEKNEVRFIAEEIGLPVFDKKDSQGVCFIGKLDMKEFLGKEIEVVPGVVKNSSGESVGTHKGAILYTVGERHGFTLFNTTPHMEPHFIIKKDLERNELTVGSEKELLNIQSAHHVVLHDVILYARVKDKSKVKVRIRHRQELQDAEVGLGIDSSTQQHTVSLHVDFKKPQSGVAPGQSCVLYDGDICVGGGIIA